MISRIDPYFSDDSWGNPPRSTLAIAKQKFRTLESTTAKLRRRHRQHESEHRELVDELQCHLAAIANPVSKGLQECKAQYEQLQIRCDHETRLLDWAANMLTTVEELSDCLRKQLNCLPDPLAEFQCEEIGRNTQKVLLALARVARTLKDEETEYALVVEASK